MSNALGRPYRGVQPDDFDERARRFLAKQDRPDLTKISIEEWARKGAWSGNNQLGQSRKLTSGEAASEVGFRRETVLKLDEWGFPEVWTVSLGINFIEEDPSAEALLYQAEITFGSGGATQTLVMDWVRGAMISLPMNAVEVACIYNGANITDNSVEVSVLLSWGDRTGGMPAVVSLHDADITIASAAVSTPIDIPKFVKRIKFACSDDTAAEAVAFYNAANRFQTLRNNTGPVINQTVTGVQLLALGSGLDVFGGAKSVRIMNDSGTTVSARIYGELYV